jgi:omega-6 fatty acid desaturase (delta-12 desaturase)
MFGLGPSYLFVLRNRLPADPVSADREEWLSTLGTNGAIAVTCTALIYTLGPLPFLLVHVPIVLVAASMGVWLFYVQHQFEDTFWAKDGEWEFHHAALHGSSHYDLPLVLRRFSANIGIHHVHHLYSRIPFYRLGQVLRDHPPAVSSSAGSSTISTASSSNS